MRSQNTALAALAVAVAAVAPSTASADIAYGVTLEQTLIRFDTSSPTVIQMGAAITGLAQNEVIRGIDFRPATGQLYALGSQSNLYIINVATGAATQVGGPLSTVLNGSSFGFDFNPTVDRIRVTSDANQNLRLNPITGAIAAVDGSLQFAAADVNAGQDPNGVHAAYTNSFAGATATTLYIIDTGLDILATQSPPNNGTLNTVGGLGVDVQDMGGFDIGQNNVAFAAIRPVGSARTFLYTINLATGAATQVDEIGGGAILTAFAVIPTPGSATLIGLSTLAMLRRTRR
ncbi:MAG TPA: DUF4394 domain-containing protein [Phycisphaerales bacterium]|nr:DUF4394 domain-containing protein [Phycisphaerales bacterium]